MAWGGFEPRVLSANPAAHTLYGIEGRLFLAGNRTGGSGTL